MFRRATVKAFFLFSLTTVVCLIFGSSSCGSDGGLNRNQPSTPSPPASQSSKVVPSPSAGLDPCKQYTELCITEPQNEAKVEPRPFVRGKVATPNAKVWVVVHPTGTSEFWVQPPVTVTKGEKEGGAWSVQVYVGDSATKDETQFEIMAIADPDKPVTVGKRVDWPGAKWKSNVVTVAR